MSIEASDNQTKVDINENMKAEILIPQSKKNLTTLEKFVNLEKRLSVLENVIGVGKDPQVLY